MQIASTDFAAQARNAALAAGQGIQTGAMGVGDQFNKFVEGDENGARRKVEPERKDFWDSFGGNDEPAKPSSIGTSAMKKAPGPTQKKKEDSGWGDDW